MVLFFLKNELIQVVDCSISFACEGGQSEIRASGSGQRKNIYEVPIYFGHLWPFPRSDQTARPFRPWPAPDVGTKKALPARRAILLLMVPNVLALASVAMRRRYCNGNGMVSS
jgi:hypothetical protein